MSTALMIVSAYFVLFMVLASYLNRLYRWQVHCTVISLHICIHGFTIYILIYWYILLLKHG